MKAATKINPEEFILSALPPQERLEAAFRVAREAFKHTALTLRDIEKAVQKARKKVRKPEK